eukprot:gene18727-13491_t
MSLVSKVLQFVKPSFYAKQYARALEVTREEIHSGSIRPLFKAMALIGFTGYSLEYALVGRHHVAEKQAIIKEAMKHHHH